MATDPGGPEPSIFLGRIRIYVEAQKKDKENKREWDVSS